MTNSKPTLCSRSHFNELLLERWVFLVGLGWALAILAISAASSRGILMSDLRMALAIQTFAAASAAAMATWYGWQRARAVGAATCTATWATRADGHGALVVQLAGHAWEVEGAMARLEGPVGVAASGVLKVLASGVTEIEFKFGLGACPDSAMLNVLFARGGYGASAFWAIPPSAFGR